MTDREPVIEIRAQWGDGLLKCAQDLQKSIQELIRSHSSMYKDEEIQFITSASSLVGFCESMDAIMSMANNITEKSK